MLIKSSAKSHRLQSTFFCLFIIISTVLVSICTGIIFPLSDNLENKVKNHVCNRELSTQFTSELSDENIEGMLDMFRKLENVVSVYRAPAGISVFDNSEKLTDGYSLAFAHNGGRPIITSGRDFDESDTGVALLAQNIRDYDFSTGLFSEINGEEFIGKILEFSDYSDNVYKFEIVGTFSTADPLYEQNQIIIPRSDLLRYNNHILETEEHPQISDDKDYIIEVDNYKNTDAVLAEALDIRMTGRMPSLFDSEAYSIALIILLGSLAVLIIVSVVVFYIFLKTNTASKTSELALYRSLGYKSRHIFYILFFEHLLFGTFALIFGSGITALLNTLIVNPYLYSLTGNTLMEMTVDFNFVQLISIALVLLIMLFTVCKAAARKTEKIDLTILLRSE